MIYFEFRKILIIGEKVFAGNYIKNSETRISFYVAFGPNTKIEKSIISFYVHAIEIFQVADKV